MIAVTAAIWTAVGAAVILGLVMVFCFLDSQLNQGKRHSFRSATEAPIWPDKYQPRETESAWMRPIRFSLRRACPHCGHFDTHRITKPNHDEVYAKQYDDQGLPKVIPFVQRKRKTLGDNSDAAMVRICANCQHMWGEK